MCTFSAAFKSYLLQSLTILNNTVDDIKQWLDFEMRVLQDIQCMVIEICLICFSVSMNRFC